jgi:hypothetical protein
MIDVKLRDYQFSINTITGTGINNGKTIDLITLIRIDKCPTLIVVGESWRKILCDPVTGLTPAIGFSDCYAIESGQSSGLTIRLVNNTLELKDVKEAKTLLASPLSDLLGITSQLAQAMADMRLGKTGIINGVLYLPVDQTPILKLHTNKGPIEIG